MRAARRLEDGYERMGSEGVGKNELSVTRTNAVQTHTKRRACCCLDRCIQATALQQICGARQACEERSICFAPKVFSFL